MFYYNIFTWLSDFQVIFHIQISDCSAKIGFVLKQSVVIERWCERSIPLMLDRCYRLTSHLVSLFNFYLHD